VPLRPLAAPDGAIFIATGLDGMIALDRSGVFRYRK